MAKTHIIDGKTYVEVERKAEVGEKVIIIKKGTHHYEIGDITVITKVDAEKSQQTRRGNSDYGWLYEEEYRVLEPVIAEDWPPLTEESIELTANDIRWQPDKVIDLLANLARRLSALERALERRDQQIDTLFGNVQRQGEELEAVRYGNDEMYLRLKGVEQSMASHRDELNAIDHEKAMIFEDIVSLSKRIRKLNGGAAE